MEHRNISEATMEESSQRVITTYIELGGPWENGYIESFNARMRNEFLNGELFGNMYDAEVLIER